MLDSLPRLTVVELSNTFLQYSTGAAATTFVVNDPAIY